VGSGRYVAAQKRYHRFEHSLKGRLDCLIAARNIARVGRSWDTNSSDIVKMLAREVRANDLRAGLSRGEIDVGLLPTGSSNRDR